MSYLSNVDVVPVGPKKKAISLTNTPNSQLSDSHSCSWRFGYWKPTALPACVLYISHQSMLNDLQLTGHAKADSLSIIDFVITALWVVWLGGAYFASGLTISRRSLRNSNFLPCLQTLGYEIHMPEAGQYRVLGHITHISESELGYFPGPIGVAPKVAWLITQPFPGVLMSSLEYVCSIRLVFCGVA